MLKTLEMLERAMRVRQQQRNRIRRGWPTERGFTLVELLVVITIIGVLAGLAVKGIAVAIRIANENSILTEVEGLSQALNEYKRKHGEFPPDFSNWTVVERHYRKAYPKIVNSELELLLDLAYPPQLFPFVNFNLKDVASLPSDPQGIDRAEALVFALGGYSSDAQRPFTGAGGPLAPSKSWTVSNAGNLTYYQYNPDRPNAFFDFKGRLLLTTIPDPHNTSAELTISSDESVLDGVTNYADILPVFHSRANQTPYVYFSSRTYDFPVTRDWEGKASAATTTMRRGTDMFFNYYAKLNLVGVARPYKSATKNTQVTSASNILLADYGTVYYEERETFQIISAGLDGEFGGGLCAASDSINTTAALSAVRENLAHYGPVLYTFPSGEPFAPRVDTSIYSKYSSMTDGSINGQLDNVTNFSGKTLDNALP